MPAVFALGGILAAAALIWQLARRGERRRKHLPGPAGYLEYRTDLPFDGCLDALAQASPQDVFAYTCPRQADGTFLLHQTLHNPSNQSIDSVFTLRMDSGRQTVITLHFLREAFGYREPVFPQELMDEFMAKQLGARRVR